ncbi:NAD-dependent epimerase/dehydratase family protein [Mucilaginibacter boryungensis]|uniref:NAD-dependent epimerase/dehydratase family protein n=1 Tax=Mucilaginibacter boryungensis TaxID=768480 RepID=A0ABR9XKI0_9SPHI|nr:NAD-dependent epimerase/dehydratase family protein [Mucilaginibacter boryungensis]MBE9667896.1 NAD-dependent epimerase/dehydratase family protein [Mucilaginibacter boryungensis]
MKLLIIGSKGFIGSHLADFLLSKNYNVYECDVAVDYLKTNYITIDATNSDFHAIFSAVKPDVCINCSGAASVPDSLIHPLRDYILNTQNVFKMLDAIRIHQPACKFINLSSAAIYGNPAALPVKESFIPAPISPYGWHKMQAEMICKEFYDYYQISTCSLRIFSAYGAGLTKQLLWDLHKKFTTNAVVELFGTGNETRDFINIHDLVNAIDCCIHNARFEGEFINVGNGVEISIKQIADYFKTHYQLRKEVVFNGHTKPGDPLYWRADISLLTAMGYKYAIDIETGIKQYISWAKTV